MLIYNILSNYSVLEALERCKCQARSMYGMFTQIYVRHQIKCLDGFTYILHKVLYRHYILVEVAAVRKFC